MKNGKIHFKTKEQAERFFKAEDPLEKRLKKIEKKQQENETRLNNIWKVILINNLELK